MKLLGGKWLFLSLGLASCFLPEYGHATHDSKSGRPALERSWTKPDTWGRRPSPLYGLSSPVRFEDGKKILDQNLPIIKEAMELAEEWSQDPFKYEKQISQAFDQFFIRQTNDSGPGDDIRSTRYYYNKEEKEEEKKAMVDRLKERVLNKLKDTLYRYFVEQWKRVLAAGKIEEKNDAAARKALPEATEFAGEAKEFWKEQQRRYVLSNVSHSYKSATGKEPSEALMTALKDLPEERLQDLARVGWRLDNKPQKERFAALLDSIVKNPENMETEIARHLLLDSISLSNYRNREEDSAEAKAYWGQLKKLDLPALRHLGHIRDNDYAKFYTLVQKPENVTSAHLAEVAKGVPVRPRPVLSKSGERIKVEPFTPDTPLKDAITRMDASMEYLMRGDRRWTTKGNSWDKSLVEKFRNGRHTRQQLIDEFGDYYRERTTKELADKFKDKPLDENASAAEKWEILMEVRKEIQEMIKTTLKPIEAEIKKTGKGDRIEVLIAELMAAEEGEFAYKSDPSPKERLDFVKKYLKRKKDQYTNLRNFNGTALNAFNEALKQFGWPADKHVSPERIADDLAAMEWLEGHLEEYQFVRDARYNLADLDDSFPDWTKPDTWKGKFTFTTRKGDKAVKSPLYPIEDLPDSRSSKKEDWQQFQNTVRVALVKAAENTGYHAGPGAMHWRAVDVLWEDADRARRAVYARNSRKQGQNRQMIYWAQAMLDHPGLTRQDIIEIWDPFHEVTTGSSLKKEWVPDDDEKVSLSDYLAQPPSGAQLASLRRTLSSILEAREKEFYEKIRK